jgi:hypothetical protein
VAEVIYTDEFGEWFDDLDEQAAEDVAEAVDVLERRGVTLGFPQSSEIKGASFALRELRIQSGGRPFRVFYAFDPKRQAALLIGGDKTGDDRFYEKMVPMAEAIWSDYLKEQHYGQKVERPPR